MSYSEELDINVNNFATSVFGIWFQHFWWSTSRVGHEGQYESVLYPILKTERTHKNYKLWIKKIHRPDSHTSISPGAAVLMHISAHFAAALVAAWACVTALLTVLSHIGLWLSTVTATVTRPHWAEVTTIYTLCWGYRLCLHTHTLSVINRWVGY